MLFKNGQFGEALEKYTQAIDGCKQAGIDSPEDLCILYSNRAACYLKDGNSADCIQDCTSALELRPFSLKPLLRRAMAYESLERYRKAYVDYKIVLQVDVSVQAAQDSVHRITKLLIEQDGTDWREKLPEIPMVPLSAQQHSKEEPARVEQEKGSCPLAGVFGVVVLLKHPFQGHFFFSIRQHDLFQYFDIQTGPWCLDYLSSSADLQEVLQLDPNVQEAEKELEEVTALLKESLLQTHARNRT
ncbi:hypothetical protein P4O66_003538 [Electrophorus voltai]|uniref:Uncharacterized protein n=1 Tax=Electrophorus voltai TaxID=2609070 RepID=A0AAD8ZSQ7_9TELE|nr:hypothetical protein P4O66_003538 [Electrophorus voltai]